MAKRRERLQIIHDILKAIMDKKGKIKPTHILYKSNLSPQMLSDYLKELIQNGFINESLDSSRKSYELTQKGRDYLERYKTINDFMDSFGLI